MLRPSWFINDNDMELERKFLDTKPEKKDKEAKHGRVKHGLFIYNYIQPGDDSVF